jgi:hypothetical protein
MKQEARAGARVKEKTCVLVQIIIYMIYILRYFNPKRNNFLINFLNNNKNIYFHLYIYILKKGYQYKLFGLQTFAISIFTFSINPRSDKPEVGITRKELNFLFMAFLDR